MVVPFRHVLLGILAAFVVVAGVYLFIEVRSTSAAVTPAHPEPKAVVAASDDSARPAVPANHRAGDHRFAHEDPRPTVVAGSATAPQEDESTDDTIAALEKANPKLDAIMDQANKHYDKGEFEDAKAIAGKVLSKQPTNIRMMRIMVSSSCVDGDQAVAQKWFEQLPKLDREQMKVRCDKYQVTLKDPPQ